MNKGASKQHPNKGVGLEQVYLELEIEVQTTRLARSSPCAHNQREVQPRAWSPA